MQVNLDKKNDWTTPDPLKMKKYVVTSFSKKDFLEHVHKYHSLIC